MQNNENEKNYENDELKDLISDYSKDNDLHQKIKKMKQQKEEQDAILKAKNNDINPLTGNKYQSPIFEENKKTSSFANISADTQKMDLNEDKFIENTMEKTLVIMDGKKSLEPKEDEPENLNFVDDEDEEEDEKPKFHLFSKHKDTDDETEEMDEIDEEKNNKVNKIITYVIIVIIALLVLSGIFVGAKMILNKVKKPADTELNSEKLPQEDQNSKPVEDATDHEESNNEDVIDNSGKISSLKEQKSIYEEKKKNAEAQIKKLKPEINHDTKELQEKFKKVEEIQTKMMANRPAYSEAKQSLEEIRNKYNAETDEEEKAKLKSEMDEIQSKITEYEQVENEFNSIKADYTASSDRLKNKTNELKENENIVKSMNEEIKNIDNQLRELQ